MPYLTYLYCEKCGEFFNLDLDFIETIKSYREEGRKDTFIDDQTIIWDYLIYNCQMCHSKYKYTYRDVEKKVREYICTLSDQKKEYFLNLDKQIKLQKENLSNKRTKPNPIIRIRDRYTHKNK